MIIIKRLVGFICILLLVACGTEETKEEPEEKQFDEGKVKEFVIKYNEQVESVNNGVSDLPTIEEIDVDSIGDPFEEGKGYWQTIHTTDEIDGEGHYEIDLKYNKQKELTGYHVSVYSDSKDNETVFHNRGVASIPIVVEVLGLDTMKYSDEFIGFLGDDGTEWEYEDGDYVISFLDFSETGNIIINIDKLE